MKFFERLRGAITPLFFPNTKNYITFARGVKSFWENINTDSPQQFVKSLVDTTKTVAKKGIESLYADKYSPEEFTFAEAYKDARSKGQRTFFWNGKYYNTDYEGVHGKQYKADVASGKAAAWEQQYPGFTNPELRKEKQEELDTYGITNEQTKNKTWKDRLFRKIPARGYDLNNVISAIIGEHNAFSQYNTVDELITALRKKYPQMKDVPITGGYTTTIDGRKAIYLDEVKKDDIPNNIDPELSLAFQNDVSNYAKWGGRGGNYEEIHRHDLDYLLGYPLVKPIMTSPSVISKYRTGNDSYYYTTPALELSTPFVPQTILDIRDKSLAEREQMDALEKSITHPNASKLDFRTATSKEIEAAYNKDYNLPENKDKYKKYSDYVIRTTKPRDDFQDKYYSDSTYRKKWNNVGVSLYGGGFDLEYPNIFRNASSAEIDSLGRMGAFDYIKPLEMVPGNRLAGSGDDDYYTHDSDYFRYTGKYKKYIDWLKKYTGSKENHNEYNKKAYNTSDFIYSEPTLGVYTLGVPKDSSYFSVWDKFDIDPFGSGNDKPIIQVGTPYEFYTRFYPEGQTPDIDKLYENFNVEK